MFDSAAKVANGFPRKASPSLLGLAIHHVDVLGSVGLIHTTNATVRQNLTSFIRGGVAIGSAVNGFTLHRGIGRRVGFGPLASSHPKKGSAYVSYILEACGVDGVLLPKYACCEVSAPVAVPEC